MSHSFWASWQDLSHVGKEPNHWIHSQGHSPAFKELTSFSSAGKPFCTCALNFTEQIHVNTLHLVLVQSQGRVREPGSIGAIFPPLLIAKPSGMAIQPCWEGCDMPGLGTISLEGWILHLSHCQFPLQTGIFFIIIKTKGETVCILLPAWAICHRHLGQCSNEQREGYFDQLQPTKKEPASCFRSDEAEHLAWHFPYEGHFYKEFNWAS